MTLLTELPVELLLHIMCCCSEVTSALRFSAVNRHLQNIWHNNIACITSRIFSWEAKDLADEVDYLLAEADVAEPRRPGKTDATDLNTAVRCHVSSIERSARAASFIEAEYMKELKLLRAQCPADFPPGWRSMNDHVDAIPDYRKSILTIRRLALGYDHEQYLTAAYASIHQSSDAELNCLDSVGSLINSTKCQEFCDRMGVETHEPEDAWWAYGPSETFIMPLGWEFALQIISIEYWWRFGVEDLDWKKSDFERQEYVWGEERMALMYGTFQAPWTKESREVIGTYRGMRMSPKPARFQA